ncbi:MAG: methyltransferase [Sphingomicrobium sp.]
MNLFLAAAIVAAPFAAPFAAEAVVQAPANVAAVLASPARSADNVKLDTSRRPVQLLRFLGLRRGMHVLDMFGGNRYWVEIVAPAIGPQGKVVVWEPKQFYDDDSKKTFAAFAEKNRTVSIVSSPFEAPDLPKDYAEFVLINLNYHDVYWESAKYGIKRMEPAAFLKALYAAVKPGGIVGVIDHSAKPGGDTRAVVEKLHRIDPAVVKADFQHAGFRLEGESRLYANRADNRSLLVFDPKIQGKTDRFVFKFRKPR